MDILIDNRNLLSDFNINILDYSDAFSIAAERENEREWYNKSGVDRNLINGRFESKEFVLYCYVKDANEALAYSSVNELIEYMLMKKIFVLSFRDIARNIRECFLCERSKTIAPEISIRLQNSLFVFKIGFKDINPNAIKYKTLIENGELSINYTKGQTASIFWGNGDRGIVNNSGIYTKSDYNYDGVVDVIIDIDKTELDMVELSADFIADKTNIVKVDSIQFTDNSIGLISVWSWIIAKGETVIYTSSLQNPLIEFTEDGVYTVTLQVFNAVAGSSIKIKTNYITVRNSRILLNDYGDFALKSIGNYGLKN